MLQPAEQPTQLAFVPLDDHDNDSSQSESNTTTFKCPLGFRVLQKRIEKFSGKSNKNDFDVWLVDFMEATTNCMHVNR